MSVPEGPVIAAGGARAITGTFLGCHAAPSLSVTLQRNKVKVLSNRSTCIRAGTVESPRYRYEIAPSCCSDKDQQPLPRILSPRTVCSTAISGVFTNICVYKSPPVVL